MKDIHVLTPFYRTHLAPTLIHYLEPMGVQWYPICEDRHYSSEFSSRNWITPLLVDALSESDQCYIRFNQFQDAHLVDDNDYYCFMGDDDAYEPGFFDIIRRQTAKILIVSLSRGDRIPECDPEKHPTNPLIMNSIRDVQVCNIGLPQYIIKGEIFKQMRFRNDHCWNDGHFAEKLKEWFPNDFHFLPDTFVFGNYFQEGRYFGTQWMLKPTWRHPRIIK